MGFSLNRNASNILAWLLFLGQFIHSRIQSNRDFIERLNRKVVSSLLAFNLTDEVMRQPNHFSQLSRSQTFFLTILLNISPYRIIYRVILFL